MVTEPSLWTIDASPRNGEQPAPPSLHVMAGIVGCFFGWPAVVFAWLPLMTPGDTLGAWVFGAGSFLWFLSCFGMCGVMFAIVEGARRRSRALYRGMAAVIVGWFFAYPPLLVLLTLLAGDQSPDKMPVWIFLLCIVCGMLWLAAGYWIYDTLFNLAEGRWPEVKRIREIVSPLLRASLFHHHHHHD